MNMAVSVSDVRTHLNEISEAQLASTKIAQSILDAEQTASTIGIPVSHFDRFVRALTAYNSLNFAFIYNHIKVGQVDVRRDWEHVLSLLKQEVDEILSECCPGALDTALFTDSTPMFDERPTDPYEESECGNCCLVNRGC